MNLLRICLISVACLVALATTVTGADELHVPGEYPSITSAIAAAWDGDVIVVAPGTYTETVNPVGKAITIRSTDPDDPQVVAQTVLQGNGDRVVVVFYGEQLDTVIEGFTITGGEADQGGGIGVFDSDPLIRNCVIRDNSGGQGGGAYVYASSAWFDTCTFEDNTATHGGGVYGYAGTYVRFDACHFVGNTASSGGGAISSTFSDLRFEGCLIAENEAAGRGGALDSDNSRARFVSSLIRDNTAQFGGAIYTDYESHRVLNTTVVRNTATEQGGAIYGIMSQPLLRNTIVRDNHPNAFAGFSNNPTAEYSNVEGGLDGPGNIDLDPLFVDPDANDFRLQPASPSVNTGFNGWVPPFALRDLDREMRLLEGTVDMGAYELPAPPPPLPDVVGSLVVAMRDDGAMANGLETPVLVYDDATGSWTKLVRNLPAYAIAFDAANQCFWVQSGENGLLGRVPIDTYELEEIGVLKYQGSPSSGLSGLAVRDGVLYASAWLVGTQADRLYTVDTTTARLSLVHEFPPEFEVWDLHYDPLGDRMLVLSSPEAVPPGPVGVFELDLDTFALTEVQSYFKDDPGELNWLQGLATGPDTHSLFRSPYNRIEIFDAKTLAPLQTISIPDSIPRPGAGWLLGGLAWLPEDLPVASTPDAPPAHRLALRQNWPNPFAARTEIAYRLDTPGPVRLDVYGVSGRLVQTLVDGNATPGWHRISWDGTDRRGRPVPAGVYYYRLQTPVSQVQRSLRLVR